LQGNDRTRCKVFEQLCKAPRGGRRPHGARV
jgi:hypothetical protein